MTPATAVGGWRGRYDRGCEAASVRRSIVVDNLSFKQGLGVFK